MRDIVLLALVSMAVLKSIRRPSFGMVTFAFLGFFNPQSYTWGFASTFPFSQVVAVSTILGLFLSSERKALTVHRETVWLILLWAFFGISTLGALYPDEAWAQYIYISKIFLMILVATVVIHSEENLHSLIRVIGYTLGFYGLKGGLFALASGGGLIVYGPENSFLAANNSIGLALAMNIPVLLYLLKKEQSVWLRWLTWAMLIFSYPAIVCTYSRGAWLGMTMATVLGLLKSKNKFVMVGLAGMVVMALQIAAPYVAPDRLTHRYDELVNYEDDSSAQSRFWNWEFCKRVGLARPMTGGGFQFYHLASYVMFYPEFLQRWPGKVWTCHSTWLTIFGEHGIPGSVIWLSLLASTMVSLRQLRHYTKSSPNKEYPKGFVDMVQSSLVAYFVVGTFLDAAYFDLLYYFIAMVIIQKGIIMRAAKDEDRLIVPAGIGVTIDRPFQLRPTR